MDKFYVAWWSSETWGSMSEVFNRRDLVEKWIADQKAEENFTYYEIVEFDTKKQAETYRMVGA